MDFGHNLRTMRAARNLTQIELAEAAMTSQVFVSAIELGKMLPSPELESRLRKALGWNDLDDKALEMLEREAESA